LPTATKGIIVLGSDQYEPFAEVLGDRPFDDHAEEGSLAFAVWSAADNAAIDWSVPPSGLFRGELLFASGTPRHLFTLGAESVCSVSSFDFPEAAGLKLGVRAVDLAGNLGPANELTLELVRPRRGP
jgi:hypothetical protein